MSRLQDVITWKPDQPGRPEAHADRAEDRRRSFSWRTTRSRRRSPSARSSSACWSSIRIPRWEYRYLRNALERDPGVEVHMPALPARPRQARRGPRLPRGLSEGRRAGEVRRGLPRRCRRRKGPAHHRAMRLALQKLVRDQAAGLVFLPGLRGFEASLLKHRARRLDADRLGRRAAARLGHLLAGPVCR